MKKTFAGFAAASVFALATATAIAHHSFSAEFDADKPFIMKGTVTKIEWMNPHTYFYIDVTNPDGKVELGHGDGQPQRPDASGLDAQHDENRRCRHGRRQSGIRTGRTSATRGR